MADSRADVEFDGLQRPTIWRDIFSKFDTCIALIAIAETASVIFAAYAAKLVYFGIFLHLEQPDWPYLAPAGLLALIAHLFLKQAGLYDIDTINDVTVPYGKIWGALATSFLVLLGILYVLKFADWYSRGWFLSWFALSSVVLVAVRIAAMGRVRQLVERGFLRQRIALYGTHEFVNAVRSEAENADRSLAIEGFFISKPMGIRLSDPAIDDSLYDLKAAIARRQFDTVIICLPASEAACIHSSVRELASYSTDLLLCTELNRYPVTIQGARNFGQLRTSVVNLVPLSERNRLLKSLTDLIVAGIALVLLAPFLALVALAIKLDSPGPVLFRQRRYGQNNRVFRIFKFRTMTVAEDGQNVEQAKRNDSRVTRVGWFLRRTSIDELPQLINVLKGEMSIVGPRPHALAHDMIFEQQQDRFSQRRRVLPGLTGWAQVNGFRGATRTPKDIQDRLQYDLYYIENWSIWLDLEIMVRTILVLFRGAY
ncbi:exopolysaccharide biosynthesis polyprenyl glycosylphosphotransferase [Hyphomicrobium denitrificans 1NES1]|uniref:Exopolysaccharide biosynthesis polyprenyl glycosylphosphotransferase n=1 Tax=Hyphomicrobium denitrificans 1NES1 TaxID=670307 RepID=N0B287_9HYPH|nr:undecaprenyl-phosphate glucose phosphotransferase [Hyphomicrobium denitrificans]AGK57604.1 exopolysaccharide biosynthesis polyprenyl glycosylphosphotransferase [Hyphomicrobium denitrificans 1NES1]